jgi:3-oxoacyl-[acyl-carrier-protein] synthase II
LQEQDLNIGGEFPEIRGGKIDREDLQALWILKFLPNTAASIIAKLSEIHGENLTVSTACSASLQAIGEAFRKIKDGYLDFAFAGGGDSRLNPGGILAYKKAGAL